MQQRIWEIDYFRGIAILLMIVFHLIVDLKDFHGFPLEYLSGFWYYEGKLSAIIFIFLAGISSNFNCRQVRHAGKVLAGALLVSFVTYYTNGDTFVRFGILHLLGLSILSSTVLLRFRTSGLVVMALLLLVLQRWTTRLTADSGCLLPLGVTPAVFSSIDYYPLIPWLGVFVFGILAGRGFYGQQRSILPQWRGTSGIIWLGRRSLLIYLVHQPLLLALLYSILQ